ASTYIWRNSVLSWPKIIARLSQFQESGRTGGSLVTVFAKIGDDAARALRPPRLADIAPVQQQPVMGVLAEFGRRQPREPCLDLHRCLTRGDASAVCHPEYVGVHRNHRLPKRGVEYNVRGLPAHPWQR